MVMRLSPEKPLGYTLHFSSCGRCGVCLHVQRRTGWRSPATSVNCSIIRLSRVVQSLHTSVAFVLCFFVMQVFGVEVAAAKLHFAGVARVEIGVTLGMAHISAMFTK